MGNMIDRGAKVLMNTYSRFPISLVEGKGMYVTDEHGKEYLDFLAGIAVNVLGHAHPTLLKAISDQAGKMIHCSNLYNIPQQTLLAEKLINASAFDKAFFCNSGTEANEAAIKLARKWGKIHKNGAYKILALDHSFHGRTIGALSLTGQKKYQESFIPLMPGADFVPLNDLETLASSIDKNTCAVIIEPVQGEGGIYPARKNYLQELRKICNETDTLLIFDEIQCGLGRTGSLFAYQYYEVEPDIVTLAKALGGGLPIGAILAKDSAAVFEPGDHASTFGGNPLVTAAALVVLTELIDNDLVGKARKAGSYLQLKLNGLADSLSIIKEVRGVNLMIGIEIDGEAGEVIEKCHQEGLLIGKAGTNVLRLVPPLIVEEKHIDTCIATIDRVLH